jgi:hypothetical protein
MLQFQELELTVGDILQVGDTTITVIEIEGGEVTFRIDNSPTEQQENFEADCATPSLPR